MTLPRSAVRALPFALTAALLLPAAAALTEREDAAAYTGYAEVFTGCQLEAHLASPGLACFHRQPGEYRVILSAVADDGSWRGVAYRFLDEQLNPLSTGSFCQAAARLIPLEAAMVELAVTDPVAGFACGVDTLHPGLTGTLHVRWQSDP
ncbi:MAG TPA: hypothetical protein VGR28_10070 [Candidatus Thermoplasmatota archaeon]|jgi:hypothetical protein|nr:hypothetical protein [Candidatus Thermoplasmatota archaeon]